MDKNEFKDLFNSEARNNGFEKAFGGWFKVGQECIVVLDLQKSNYGNYYELNIKVFIQGAFRNQYVKSKDLVKRDIGDIFERQPGKYRDVLDLDNPMCDSNRKRVIGELFKEFIVPFSNLTLTRKSIIEMYQRKELYILPAVRKELGIN